MDALWQQVIIQLGISGLIVFAGYKIAMQFIMRWTQVETDRTAQTAKAEDARTKAISDGFAADVAAHQQLTAVMQKWVSVLSRIEGKIDAAFDLTPVRGYRDYEMRGERDSERARNDSDEPPIPRPVPDLPTRQTPPKGVPSMGEYGPTKPPRGKTHG